jgi:Spy/CpxP family protein refolding chaperone
MRQIWAQQMGPPKGSWREKRKALAAERDQDFAAMLTEEQRSKHEEIQRQYDRRTAELAQERDAAFQEAVKQTKATLTPEQARKYEKLLQEHGGHGERMGGFGMRAKDSNTAHGGR